MEAETKTFSLWTYILSDSLRFLNPTYNPHNGPIWPNARHARLWEQQYCRYCPEFHPKLFSEQTWRFNQYLVDEEHYLGLLAETAGSGSGSGSAAESVAVSTTHASSSSSSSSRLPHGAGALPRVFTEDAAMSYDDIFLDHIPPPIPSRESYPRISIVPSFLP